MTGIWLFIEDIRHNNGILHKGGEQQDLIGMMTSPTQDERRHMKEDTDMDQTYKSYKENRSTRDALKRSMARNNK